MICIKIMDKLVSRGINDDCKKQGCYYILMALTDNIKKFESKYGEIKTPGQEGFTEFGVKPPEDVLPN